MSHRRRVRGRGVCPTAPVKPLDLARNHWVRSTLFSYFSTIHRTVSLTFSYFPYGNFNYFSSDLFLCIFFFFFFIWLCGLPYPVNKQTTLLGRRIPFEGKCVSNDTVLPEKDKAKNSKHKNSHRCMGKRETRVNGHCGPQEVFQC